MKNKSRSAATQASPWPLFLSLAGLAALVAVIAIWLCNRSEPQMKYDSEVFNTVDALFTALTSRNPDRLAACHQRLTHYQAEGRLTAPVATTLNQIITQAQNGEWEDAAKRLYAFMLGQRRER